MFEYGNIILYSDTMIYRTSIQESSCKSYNTLDKYFDDCDPETAVIHISSPIILEVDEFNYYVYRGRNNALKDTIIFTKVPRTKELDIIVNETLKNPDSDFFYRLAVKMLAPTWLENSKYYPLGTIWIPATKNPYLKSIKTNYIEIKNLR